MPRDKLASSLLLHSKQIRPIFNSVERSVCVPQLPNIKFWNIYTVLILIIFNIDYFFMNLGSSPGLLLGLLTLPVLLLRRNVAARKAAI
jgi:hypothetical protein